MMKREGIQLSHTEKVSLSYLLWQYGLDKQASTERGVNENWFDYMNAEYHKGLCNRQISLNNAVCRVLYELEKDGVATAKVGHEELEKLL